MRKNIHRSRRQYERVLVRVTMGGTVVFEWRRHVLILGTCASYIACYNKLP